MVVLSLVDGVFMGAEPSGNEGDPVWAVVSAFLFASLIFLWCYHDSRQQNFFLGKGLTFLIILVTFIGVPTYFIKSRGLLGGLKAIGFAVLFVLLCAGVAVSVSWLVRGWEVVE